MEAGKLAPPTLQFNIRQRELSDRDTISWMSNPFLPPLLEESPSTGYTAVNESESALLPDPGTEHDFKIDNNPFAFSPGQLKNLFNPKSLSAFQALGGLQEIASGLQSDTHTGLSFDEPWSPLTARTMQEADVATGERIYEIPGFVGNLSHDMIRALPDTGAKYNFMKESYAKRLRLPVQRDITCSISVTKTRTIRTVGAVAAPFTFQNETESHQLIFHLLPDCVHDVILGKAFLKATKTFSNTLLQARRVVTRFVQGIATRRLFYLGDSAPRFTGLLNGRPREALGDTGAQGLFMNEAFARAKGFPIVDGPDSILNVQFADGSTATTTGMTYGVKWEYGLGGSGKEHTLDFHILKDAPADVILSDDFLYDTEAFAEYDCYLVDEDEEDDDDDGHLFAIKLSKKQVQQGTITGATDYAYVQEAHRVAREQHCFDDLHREQALTQSFQTSSPQTQTPSPPSSLPPSLLPPPPTSTSLPTPSYTSLNNNQGAVNPDPAVLSVGQPSGGNTSPTPNSSTPSSANQSVPPNGSPPQRKHWRTKLIGKMKRTKPAGST